jgi:branched-chain amino acid transport system permease protein
VATRGQVLTQGIGRRAPSAVVLLVAVLVPLLTQSAFNLGRFELFYIYCLPAMALNFASGYAGQLAFGQPVLMGLAAYATAILTVNSGQSEWLALLISIAVAMLASLIMGLPGLRVRGWYLAILTFFVIGVFGDLIDSFPGLTNGENGLVVPSLSLGGNEMPPTLVYELSLAFVVLVWLSIRNIVKSNWGISLRQMRDHPGTAEACGINLWATRVRVYLLMGIPCGLAGWLFAETQNVVAPVSFSLNLILLLIGGVFLGGEGSLWGPIIGVGIFETISLAIGPFSTWNSVFLGIGVLLSAILFRGGVVGAVGALLRRSRLPRSDVTVGSRSLPDTAQEQPGAAQEQEAAVHEAPPRDEQPAAASMIVRDVCKRFGGNEVLTSVGLELRPGEILGLIGPNGSGKTTLVNVITGILRPDSGTVEVQGIKTEGRRPHTIAQMGVRRTFQHPRLISELSVLDNVRLGACGLQRPHALASTVRSPAERRRTREVTSQALAVCDLLDLGRELRETPVSFLSLGMKRVVEVARALVGDPAVVCLDEPAAGLNVEERDALVRLMEQMRVTGMALLLVEHNLELVMRTCDHVVLLEDGHITATARPRAGVIDPHLREYLGEYAIT